MAERTLIQLQKIVITRYFYELHDEIRRKSKTLSNLRCGIEIVLYMITAQNLYLPIAYTNTYIQEQIKNIDKMP